MDWHVVLYMLTVCARGRGHSIIMEVAVPKSEEHAQRQTEAADVGVVTTHQRHLLQESTGEQRSLSSGNNTQGHQDVQGYVVRVITGPSERGVQSRCSQGQREGQREGHRKDGVIILFQKQVFSPPALSPYIFFS